MRISKMFMMVHVTVTYSSAPLLSALAEIDDYPIGGKDFFRPYTQSGDLVVMEVSLAPLGLEDARALASTAMGAITTNFTLRDPETMYFDDERILDWFYDRNRTYDIEHMVSVPQQMDINEWVILGNETTNFSVASVFTNRLESVIMNIDSNPFDPEMEAIAKYQIDCRQRVLHISQIHQLSREYFFLDMIHRASSETGIQIVPTPYFLSPPVLLTKLKSFKTDFDMPEDSRDTCVNAKAHLRYLVMEKTGLSLEDFLSHCPDIRLPVIDGLNVLKQLFVALKTIHSMGIIHGDIHRGNIVRSLSDRTKILLIDFGLARLYDGELPETSTGILSRISMDSSPWIARGYTRSFRDDVFRAIVTVASLMGGSQYLHAMDVYEQAPDRTMAVSILTHGDVFRNPLSRKHVIDDLKKHLPYFKHQRIIEQLLNLQRRARAMNYVNDFPDHDELISIVDNVIDIVSDNI